MHSFGVVKTPNSWVKFRLLMWKNYLQQWRHRRQTAIEFLLPVLTTSLVLLIRAQLDPVQMSEMAYPPIPASSLLYSKWVMQGMDFKNLSIAYSPRSPVLDGIISNVAKKFVMKNKGILDELSKGSLQPPNSRRRILRRNWVSNRAYMRSIDELQNVLRTGDLIKVTSYASKAKLRGIYYKEEKTKQIIAAVEFSDKLSGATELPAELSYALRFPERPRLSSFYGNGGHSWQTSDLYPSFEVAGPRWPFSYEGGNDPGYVNEMFIALQDLVSTELIEKLTKSSVQGFEVIVRRYPHPKYVLDYTIETLKMLFPMFIMLSFCFTAVNIVRAITVEKELQLKETMKIMGLPTWLHWMAWFWKQFIYLMISVILICIVIKVHWFKSKEGIDSYAVFTYTPFTILLFFLTLYICCMIFFCFMLSGFFSKGSTAALFAGIIWFLIYIPAFMFAMDTSMSPYVQAFTCLSVNSAMAYGFQMILAKESTGGLRWGQFFFSPGSEARFVFGHVVLMMILDCILYLLIALYLEQVMPGPFGSPQPWNFFIYKDFWRGRGIKDHVDESVNLSNDDDQSKITKENDPTGLNPGVTVKNLTKIYGINVVVNNLSFVIYDEQITVLLGHNGAGKSTTISMLTGNVQVTRGSIMLAGHDMVNNPQTARAYLGLCPQHNVLFNEMTVKEHLEFFARLKGFSGEKLNAEIDTMIKKLELEDKTDYQSHGLSGGQKRRLAVGIALCGGAKVVLLDEPTSGMDPSSRRALWDLLQQEKKGRSMVLTTHFMDEADILGDRVAIMANGRLQCVGSPYFLKQHYGVGYTLVVVKDEGFNADACTELINKYIPGTTIKEDRGTEITYSLPNQHSDKFQNMLNDLENSKGRIKYKAYGLVATTLEDVFMSVGSDLPHKKVSGEKKVTDVSTTTESFVNLNSKNSTGYRLLWNHVSAIWLKLWLIWTRFWPLVLLQLLVPILIVNGTLAVVHYAMASTGVLERRKLTIAEGFVKTETLLSYAGSSSGSVGALTKAAYEKIFDSPKKSSMKLTIVDNESVDDYYLKRMSDKNIIGIIRNQILIGATFTDNSVTAWFSNFGYHDVANSLSYVHQALLKAKMPDASLTVYNHPLEATYKDTSDLQLMMTFLAAQLSFGIGSSLGIVSAVFIMFYIKERVTGAKLLQQASGIRPYTMWFSAALFDWAWFFIICIPILISCAAFQVIGLSTFAELGRLWICLMIYGAAMLPLTYFFSCIIDGPTLGFVIMFFLNLLLGMLGPQIVNALWAPQINSRTVGDIMDAVLQFFPLYSLVTCVRLLNTAGLSQWSCKQSCDYLKAGFANFTECTMEELCKFYPDNCCGYEDYTPWAWADPGILRYVLCMILMCIIFWLALMAVEYRLFQHYLTRKKIPPKVDESTQDTDVMEESRKVDKIVQSGTLKEHSLVAHQLTKYYGTYLATNQVSFTVSDKECFGLLGVNGAGKTTTFKMLMGDEIISSGNAYVSGHSVRTDITRVHKHIGYCPQFDAVFGELTGRETMKIFSKLRGLPPEKASVRTEELAYALGFNRHLDKQSDQYSGGNRRKLSTAVALLGDTRLVFVDEPTTGVDPAARRQVWTAIQDAQREGRGVVLTSHSMEECEALCTRLTIMVNGRFQCIGAPQHLKNKFSQGFTLTIKMKMDETGKQPPEENLRKVNVVKKYISDNFTNPKIMEEYQGLLTYYLPDRNVAWSKMFGIMEKAKKELDIEDYSIAQTTLEQIFLQFTKYQKEGNS